MSEIKIPCGGFYLDENLEVREKDGKQILTGGYYDLPREILVYYSDSIEVETEDEYAYWGDKNISEAMREQILLATGRGALDNSAIFHITIDGVEYALNYNESEYETFGDWWYVTSDYAITLSSYAGSDGIRYPYFEFYAPVDKKYVLSNMYLETSSVKPLESKYLGKYSATRYNSNGGVVEGFADELSGAFSSHAEGEGCKSEGRASHAEGMYTSAWGGYSHAEGYQTKASNISAHAEGNKTVATGDTSHVEGYKTQATKQMAHAEGAITIAASKYQHVQGACNIIDDQAKYLDIIGNSEDENNRSNASATDWSGNQYLAGSLYVGTTNWTNPATDATHKVATEKFVTDQLQSLINRISALENK